MKGKETTTLPKEFYWNELLTSKEMILQAPFRHELIDQKPVLTLQAVPNKFNQVWMMKLAKIVNFCLHVVG